MGNATRGAVRGSKLLGTATADAIKPFTTARTCSRHKAMLHVLLEDLPQTASLVRLTLTFDHSVKNLTSEPKVYGMVSPTTRNCLSRHQAIQLMEPR